MSIQYRPPSTKAQQPAPPEFPQQFVEGGWRRIERLYGARSDRLLKWIEMSGGDALYRRRAEHMRAQGRGGPSRITAVTRQTVEV